mmetsp:Transcript_7010/g.22524  ORF Transcript_7010/g.22524 Transcript_7010/m.22524 type:complete len:210 (+) Transcript_7010:381-1010(+)
MAPDVRPIVGRRRAGEDRGGPLPRHHHLHGGRRRALRGHHGIDVGVLAHAEDVVLLCVLADEGHREELHGDERAEAVAHPHVEDVCVGHSLDRRGHVLAEGLAVLLGGHVREELDPFEAPVRALEQETGELRRVLLHTEVAVELDDDVADAVEQCFHRRELVVRILPQELQPHAIGQDVVDSTEHYEHHRVGGPDAEARVPCNRHDESL